MSKKIEISKSSLVSLKAELARKQEEVNRAKSDAKNTFAHLPPQPKKQSVLSRKNTGVDSRNARDCEEIRKDEDDLKKSRTALEAKSKLYDRLSQQPSSSETEDRQFLVDFEQKSREDRHHVATAEPEEEADIQDSYEDLDSDWVEYVDCLGRTRTCLREDLAFAKEKDTKLAETLNKGQEEAPASAAEEREETPPQPELVSAAAVKREQMRQKWEEQELSLRDKTDVHYQDVLFDEARAHGVGYYGFSSDEAERRSQQEALARLRHETAARQQQAREARQRRQQQLQTRLHAARNRQRARAGLPPLEQPEPETPASEKEEESEVTETVQPEEIPQKSAEIPRKVPHVRPWDIGKEGVPEVREHQVLSQEEWVIQRRDDRPQEFAPPPTYQEDSGSSGRPQKATRKWSSRNTLFQKRQAEPSPDAGQGQDDPEVEPPLPPATYTEDVDLLGPEPTMYFTTKRQKVSQKMAAVSTLGVEQQDRYSGAATSREGVGTAPPPAYLEDMAMLGPEPTTYFTTKGQKVFQETVTSSTPGVEQEQYPGATTSRSGIEAVPPPAYLEDMAMLRPEPTMYFTTKKQKVPQEAAATSTPGVEQEHHMVATTSRTGVEIAPPPTYEYYGPSATTLRRDMDKKDMENAIVAGLKYLRKNAEDKEAQRDKGLLPIL